MQPAQDPWVPGPDQAGPPPDAAPPAAAYPDYPPTTPGYPGYPSTATDHPGYAPPGGYPPDGGYPPPGYPYVPPPVASGNQFGLLSMIFGIVSIPFSVCCSLGVALGIAGVVLGVLAVRTPNPARPADRNQGIAGLVCGGVTILLTVAKFGLLGATLVPGLPHH